MRGCGGVGITATPGRVSKRGTPWCLPPLARCVCDAEKLFPAGEKFVCCLPTL